MMRKHTKAADREDPKSIFNRPKSIYMAGDDPYSQTPRSELAKRVFLHRIESVGVRDVGVMSVSIGRFASSQEAEPEIGEDQHRKQKRIKRLKRIAQSVEIICECNKCKKHLSNKDVRLIVKCIRRQIPKSPTELTSHDYFKCPRCGNVIEVEYSCFCKSCGQRLEWKDQFEDAGNW